MLRIRAPQNSAIRGRKKAGSGPRRPKASARGLAPSFAQTPHQRPIPFIYAPVISLPARWTYQYTIKSRSFHMRAAARASTVAETEPAVKPTPQAFQGAVDQSTSVQSKSTKNWQNLTETLSRLIESRDYVGASKYFAENFVKDTTAPLVAYVNMIKVYGSIEKLPLAHKIWTNIVHDTKATQFERSQACLNMMNAYKRADLYDKAIEVYETMKTDEIHLGKYQLTTMLRIYVDLNDTNKVKEVLSKIKEGKHVIDKYIAFILLDHALKKDDLTEAKKVLAFITAQNLLDSDNVFNHMIGPLLERGKVSPEQLLDTINSLSKVGFTINRLFIGLLLRECRFDSRTEFFFKTIELMRAHNIKPDNAIYLIMMNRFRQLKLTELVERLLEEIRTRFQGAEGYRPSAELFAVSIRHFTQQKDVNKVMQLVAELQICKVVPTATLYEELIRFYTFNNLPENANQLWTEAKSLKIKFSGGLYAAAIAANEDNLDKIHELVAQAKADGLTDEPRVVQRLLQAFLFRQHMPVQAWALAKTLLQRGTAIYISDPARDRFFEWFLDGAEEKANEGRLQPQASFAKSLVDRYTAIEYLAPVAQRVFADQTYDFITAGRQGNLSFSEDQYCVAMLAQQDDVPRASEIALLAWFDKAIDRRPIAEQYLQYIATVSVLHKDLALKLMRKIQHGPEVGESLSDEFEKLVSEMLRGATIPKSRTAANANS